MRRLLALAVSALAMPPAAQAGQALALHGTGAVSGDQLTGGGVALGLVSTEAGRGRDKTDPLTDEPFTATSYGHVQVRLDLAHDGEALGLDLAARGHWGVLITPTPRGGFVVGFEPLALHTRSRSAFDWTPAFSVGAKTRDDGAHVLLVVARGGLALGTGAYAPGGPLGAMVGGGLLLEGPRIEASLAVDHVVRTGGNLTRGGLDLALPFAQLGGRPLSVALSAEAWTPSLANLGLTHGQVLAGLRLGL